MKISVLYNEAAGDGMSLTTIRRVLEEHGHELVHVIEKDSEFERVFDGDTELLVAAGGDGTVWRAANALVGRKVPLGILPAGTANNIASSLGIKGNLERVVAGWSTAERRPFDIGLLRWGPSESRVVEGVGGGLIAAGIAAMDASEAAGEHDDSEDADAKVTRALRMYHDVLMRLEPRRCRLVVDGVGIDGAFLLVEVLNIRSVGPNLVLGADVDSSDAVLDLVLAEEEHRDQLARYLQDRIAGKETRLHLPTRRAAEIEIEGLEEMHVDDDLRRCTPAMAATIHVQAAALEVLSPDHTYQRTISRQ